MHACRRTSEARQIMKSFACHQSHVRARARVPGGLRLRPAAALAGFVFAVLGVAQAAGVHASEADHADAVSFDTTFLRTDPKQTVDVTRFSRGNRASPGMYTVDIVVNDTRVARQDVRFVAAREGESAHACFSHEMLQGFGIDFARIGADTGSGAQTSGQASANDCVGVTEAVPGASVDFDFSEQKLTLTVPHKYMRNAARGYVPPDMRQQGVNAGFISYGANAYRTDGPGMHSTQSYLGINAGLNLGAWHLRHQSSVSAATGQPTQFDNIATYVQHDVAKLKSQVTLGDANTTGDVFDSVSFRGAQIATDDRMLPESLRGYAPVVRGTAGSNARVTIRQNGQVIYETSVSPGRFEITDLYATGYGGDLDVMVTEADGRAKSFSVPYASVAQSLRPGTTGFSATAGQLRDDSLETKPMFAQFTLQRGLTNLVTAYGGGVVAQGYVAADLGAALNTKYGAFSADVTGAQTQVLGESAMRGTSLPGLQHIHLAHAYQRVARRVPLFDRRVPELVGRRFGA
jgi:outer membrane usher protein